MRPGRLALRQSTLAALDVRAGSVDKAFTVNVNVFWVADASRALGLLHDLLRPGGTLTILYGGGPTGSDRVSGPIEQKLRNAGFTGVTRVGSEAGTGLTAVRPDTLSVAGRRVTRGPRNRLFVPVRSAKIATWGIHF